MSEFVKGPFPTNAYDWATRAEDLRKSRSALNESLAQVGSMAWLNRLNAEAERRWLKAGGREITRYRF